MTTTQGVNPRTDADDTPLGRAPLWIVSGQLGLIFAIIAQFGAYNGIKPRLVLLVMFLATAGVVLLGPLRRINRVVIGMAPLFYLAWWLASYLWTFNLWVWVYDTQMAFPIIAALVVTMTLLPYRAVTRALVTACYLAIGWTLIYTALYPGTTMSHSDGVPGWHGHFIHKNGMAPFMIFAIITIGLFEERRGRRAIAIALAAFLVVMSQSTTGLLVGAALLPFYLFLKRIEKAPNQQRSFLLLVGSFVAVSLTAASILYLPTLVGAAGKDPTLSRRTETWENVVSVIADRPWVGYGIGGAWIDLGSEPTRSLLEGLGFIVYHSHNGYLEILLQLGVVGLTLFLGFLFAYYRVGLRLLDSRHDLAVFMMMFGVLIILTSISEVTTFGIWFALLVSTYSLAVRESSSSAV